MREKTARRKHKPALDRFSRAYARQMVEHVSWKEKRPFRFKDLSPGAISEIARVCRAFRLVCAEWITGKPWEGGHLYDIQHGHFQEGWNIDDQDARYVDRVIESLPDTEPFVGGDGKIHIKSLLPKNPSPKTPIVLIVMDEGFIQKVVSDRPIVVIRRDGNLGYRHSYGFYRPDTEVDRKTAKAHVEILGARPPRRRGK